MNKQPTQLSQTSNSIDKSWTERAQEGKLRAKNNLNGYSNWQLVGSNSSLSLNLTPSDGSFQLRVTINDGYDSNEAIKIVDYINDGGDCPPFELCS